MNIKLIIGAFRVLTFVAVAISLSLAACYSNAHATLFISASEAWSPQQLPKRKVFFHYSVSNTCDAREIVVERLVEPILSSSILSERARSNFILRISVNCKLSGPTFFQLERTQVSHEITATICPYSGGVCGRLTIASTNKVKFAQLERIWLEQVVLEGERRQVVDL